jgi:hypothetical protein
MDLLVNDVKQVVEALGSYWNQFLANFFSAKEIWGLKSLMKDNSGLSNLTCSNWQLIHN